MKLKNIINDENDEEKDENELLYKEENNLGNVLIEGKINEFKVKIIKQFNYFEEHYIINALLKLLFGLVILTLPFICIIIFISINFSEKNNYFFLPYFISVCFNDIISNKIRRRMSNVWNNNIFMGKKKSI